MFLRPHSIPFRNLHIPAWVDQPCRQRLVLRLTFPRSAPYITLECVAEMPTSCLKRLRSVPFRSGVVSCDLLGPTQSPWCTGLHRFSLLDARATSPVSLVTSQLGATSWLRVDFATRSHWPENLGGPSL